ncbi:MAG TPA: diguanylate cyclase [Anaeromyxobacter sp.]|nr:diguanylate cyclase [Anaeromyxobacter sp.]
MSPRSAPWRILVAEDSAPMVAALRRALERAGYAVDAVALSAGMPEVPPAAYAAAIVHQGALGAELRRALHDLDPHLPVVGLLLDEEEAAQGMAEMEAEGVLVGPLNPTAVVGTVRLAERLGRVNRRAAQLAAVAARRVDSAQELAFLKRALLLEVNRSKRYGYPVSLALFAVDRWAEQKTRLAPQARAALLADLLALLTSSVRDIDLSVPFGEDRLLVLMPHTKPEGALKVAVRLVARIRDRDPKAPVTVSAGVAGHAGGGTVSFGSLVKRAAEALTRARAKGGDRAEPADPPPKRNRVVMG